jgi:hypothetical protein
MAQELSFKRVVNGRELAKHDLGPQSAQLCCPSNEHVLGIIFN